MEPSDEAKAAAIKILSDLDDTEGLIDWYSETTERVAAAFDDHTAALRAEVEALRARVAELEAKEKDAFTKELEAVEIQMEARRNRLTGRWKQ